MRFKDFITKQRVGIFVIGLAIFLVSLFFAHRLGSTSLRGELAVDLAASSVTIIFTALIIDYLGVQEDRHRTRNAADLAEDEIAATCFRVKWRMSRLFGLERKRSFRENISNREEAREYLTNVGREVDEYLAANDLMDHKTKLVTDMLPRYVERLQVARTELEQTLLLYEYAMDYSLRERVLNLRSELQVADNVLGFLDFSETLNKANASLVRVLSKSIYDAVEQVLEHDSGIAIGTPINDKDSSLV